MCPTRNVVIAQRVSVSPNASAKRHDETEPSLPQRAPKYQPLPSINSKSLETWSRLISHIVTPTYFAVLQEP
jgi:hypothetical protein